MMFVALKLKRPNSLFSSEGDDATADVLLRLVAYNGTVATHLDEKFSAIQNNLSNSKLLRDFVDGRFTMCYGLAKLPRRTQVKSKMVKDQFKGLCRVLGSFGFIYSGDPNTKYCVSKLLPVQYVVEIW